MHACSVKSNSLPPQGLTRLLSPWDSPGRNPGVGCCALLQGSSRPRIKLASPALQVDSLPPSHWGKPRDCDAHQIFYFFLDVSQAPCHWGRPSDYSHQKKKKGQLWCRLLSHSGNEKPTWDSQVLSCLSWTLAVFRKLSLVHPGLWMETWSRVPHPNITKQTYV